MSLYNGTDVRRTKAADRPGVWSYVAAVLLPLIGMLLSVVAAVRGHTGPALALLATSIVGSILWAALVMVP